MKKRFQQVMSMLMCVAMLLSGMTTGVMDALAEEGTDGTAQTQEVQQGDSGNTPEAQPAAPAGDAPKNEQPAAPAGDAPKNEQPAAPAGDAPKNEQPAASAGDVPKNEQPATPAGDAPKNEQPAASAGDAPKTEQPDVPTNDAPKTEQPTNEGEGEQAAPKGDEGQNTEADGEQKKDQESVSENDGEEKNEESTPTDGDKQQAEPAAGVVSVAAQNGQPAASADCAHINKKVTGTEERVTSDWTPVDRRNHKRTVDIYQTWICEECQATGSDLLESGVEQYKTHVRLNGVCEDCGLVCQHEESIIYTMFETPEGQNAEKIDEKTHKGIVNKRETYRCTDCGVLLKEIVTKTDEGEITSHSFREGVCTGCGYECEHPEADKEVWEDMHHLCDGEEWQITAQGHTGYVVQERYTRCLNCGMSWTETIAERIQKTYEHSYSAFLPGKCMTCGYVCPHEGEIETKEEYSLSENEQWQSNEKTHTGLVDIHDIWACKTCYTYKDEVRRKRIEKTFDHYFSNGVCRTCGYQCPHTEKNSWENIVLADGESWTQVDEKTHKGIVDIHQIERCTNCNASTDTVTQSRVEKTVEHWFREGTCRNCGYVCPHDQLDSWNDYELCEGQTWQSVNDDSHKAVVNITKRIYCTNCSKHFDEPGEQNTEQTLRHSYTEESECRDCGHVCSHEGAEVYDPEWQLCEGESWQSIDEKNHQGIVDVYQPALCRHCYQTQKTLLESHVTKTAAHRYNDEGVCLDCGHVNTCKHPNKWQRIWDYVQGSWKDDGNGRTHTAEATREYTWSCDDCGMRGTEKEEPTTRTELHTFSNGVCTKCGAAETCKHEKLVQKSEEYEGGEWKDDGNGATHSRTTTLVQSAVCDICGQVVRNVLKENVVQTEKHVSDDGDTCGVCGAGMTCKHANVYEGIEYAEGDTAKDNGDGTHTFTKKIIRVTRCKDCDFVKRTNTDEVVTYTENHEIGRTSGKCAACGYVPGKCEHKNTRTRISHRTGQFYPSADGKTHWRNADVLEVTVCADCGLNLSSKVLQTNVEERVHSFEEGGICRRCGYILPVDQLCKHEQTTTYYEMKDGELLNQNEQGHTFRVKLLEKTYCTDCGMLVQTKLVKKGIVYTEAHNIDERGICWDCGYQQKKDVRDVEETCKHEHQEKNEWAIKVKLVGTDANGHTFESVVVDEVYCDDCGETLSAGNPHKKNVTEQHDYVYDRGGSRCDTCGYVNTCRHAKVNADTYMWFQSDIRSENDSQHSYIAMRVQIKTCADCGQNLGETLMESEPAKIMENHEWDGNGVCYVCGAKKPSSSGSTNRRKTETTKPAASAEMIKAFQTIDEVEKSIRKAKQVQIEVVGLKELVEHEVYARVQNLSLREQVFMTLAAADCGAITQSILDSMNDTLTAPAGKLFAELNATSVGQQKVSEVKARMNELFPIHVIQRNQVYYYVYVMTVNVTADGVEKTYYFGFRLDEFSRWQMMELTEEEAGEKTLLKK